MLLSWHPALVYALNRRLHEAPQGPCFCIQQAVLRQRQCFTLSTSDSQQSNQEASWHQRRNANGIVKKLLIPALTCRVTSAIFQISAGSKNNHLTCRVTSAIFQISAYSKNNHSYKGHKRENYLANDFHKRRDSHTNYSASRLRSSKDSTCTTSSKPSASTIASAYACNTCHAYHIKAFMA